MDRHTIAGTGDFLTSPDDEFMENNCVDDPVRLCDFQLLENRIMKTVDSVYQVFLFNDFLSKKFNFPHPMVNFELNNFFWTSNQCVFL